MTKSSQSKKLKAVVASLFLSAIEFLTAFVLALCLASYLGLTPQYDYGILTALIYSLIICTPANLVYIVGWPLD